MGFFGLFKNKKRIKVSKGNEVRFSKSRRISDNELKEIMKKEMEINKKFVIPISSSKKPLSKKTGSKKEIVKSVLNNAREIKVVPIQKENIKEVKTNLPKIKKKLDVKKIKREVERELSLGIINSSQSEIKSQREPIKQILENTKDRKLSRKIGKRDYVETGVYGFDDLLEEGIPKGSTLIVAGGAGSGKTIFCLQTLTNEALKGKKCLYMSFEEREERLIQHMEDFGWDAKDLIKKGDLRIKRFNPFDITRNVDALLAKEKGELLIDIEPIIIPKDFKPDFIVVDSLTAIASAFTGKEESYRIYIEQLFRFFEKINATSFLVTETKQVPTVFSKTGVEEFLADGVIVFYNLKHGDVRENAIEILKLRGAGHLKKIVSMQITNKGIVVYPDQEVFSDIGEDINLS